MASQFIPRPPGPSFPRGKPSFKDRNQHFNKDEHRINERIRVPQVRLIGAEGEQHGIVSTQDALRMARDLGLDLMEVAATAQPPVCKILDYGKFKYEKKKKDHDAKKKQAVVKVKEVQFRPMTDEHDLDYKFKNTKDFILDGDKVKVTVVFRGREITFTDNGRKIMERLKQFVKDFAIIEAEPKFEGKRMIMFLAPNPLVLKKMQAERTAAAKAKGKDDHKTESKPDPRLMVELDEDDDPEDSEA